MSACKKTSTHPPVISTAPIIRSFSPLSGTYNSIITIRGINFNASASNNQVTVNGKSAIVQTATDTTLTVLIPERAGTGLISVTTATGTANGNSFTYLPTIFVSGSEINGANYTAKYWKNGVETILRDNAVANIILVIGSDVYVGGSAKDLTSGFSNAVYWKNGIPVIWPTDNLVDDGGSVISLFISGNDIYGAGTAINNLTTNNVGVYWKNGVPVIMNSVTSSNAAYGISVLANDVYVASSTWGSSNSAMLWKNNTLVPITLTANEPSGFFAVFVADNNIYAAGFEKSGTHTIAKYWKNGAPVSLTDGSVDAGASSIVVSGNDVYVAGYETTGNNTIAKYWKNGIPVSLTDGSNYAIANSIQVFGPDVFVAGYETIGTKDVAIYWKNGVKTSLTNGSNQARATSIAVQ